MKPRKKSSDEQKESSVDPLHEARERFKYALEAWGEDRKRYIEDLKFRSGDQWPEGIKTARANANRPCLTVDKLGQYVRQVINDSRQNRPSIKVRPVDSDADIKVAEIYQGIVRHIEERSNADTAYDTALECAVSGNHGFIRILTEYAHEQTFDQEICVKRVRNPLTVIFDPDCQEPDGSDARFAFVIEDLCEDDFEATYPNAAKIDWDNTDTTSDWYGADKKVRIAEYFEVRKVPSLVHQLIDGTIVPDADYQTAIAQGLTPPSIIQSREIETAEVWWSKMNGKEYLAKPRKWPGRWIPVVPVWGNETDIDGKVIHTSMIHTSKDAQRLYNYSRSAFAERVALTPKSPWIAADGQIEQYENEWERSNTDNIAVLRYSPQDVAGHPVPPPQRQPAADIPAGFAQDMQLSEHDIQGALGMYNASLGATSNEKSGRAILARQREGDVANFHYHDNLARAIRHVGRIIVDLIPKVYDSTRVVRILGMDGAADMVRLDPQQPQAVGKGTDGKEIYNLGVGVYDVAVSSGPSYTTRRQEAADAMVQMTQGNPQLMPLIGDLMVKSMDWPMADEISERLKALLPPEIKRLEETDEEIPPRVLEMMDQVQQQMQAMDKAINDREQAIIALQAQLKEASDKTALEARKVEVSAYDAETKRLQAQAAMMTPEQVQAIVMNALASLMTTPDISAPVQVVPR